MADIRHDDLKAPRTRTSTAWVLAAAGAVVLLLLLVFILQNGHSTEFEFLWLSWSMGVGVAMLLSAVIGALLVITLGTGRLLQHRLVERRHRRTADSL